MANVMNPTVAPAPLFPEVAGNVFERSMGPDIPGQRGSLRFEEGVATDTDVPNDFAIGSYVDTRDALTTTTRRCSTSQPKSRCRSVPTSAPLHGLRPRRSLESSFRASWLVTECPSLSVPSTLAHT